MPATLRRTFLLAAAVTALGAASVAASADTIRVGVTAGPHAEILDVVRKVGAERGVDIRPVEFTDYVIPNQALAARELEANSFQHEPYLRNQIAKTGWKLAPVALTIASPMGFYSQKYKSFDQLPKGATVAIQNDPSNGARSLRLLAAGGVVTLKDPKSLSASIADIAGNPKGYTFVELDAAQLARSLPDVDAAAVNNNYAVQAGLDPVRDAILSETLDTPYVNILAVREEDKDKPWVKQLIDAYHSEPVKQFVQQRFKGAYVATW
ncbi:D-methionine transport system substrate-binding protein [Azospirillum fermentarium]|uniref:MetQ/NlpA family ABC transporter substrate-binding protein n=1 Tax=Azospirillum fermentarium TaxID=1233114 RepID=UPI00222763A5|nr:MetQ/NlpA family ABC transporter substrate-binding protein [Azospirillum fermentarium]MCW2249016.1 D-methionine transport system substrate-binding protein [Azospirillum fermentarium]